MSLQSFLNSRFSIGTSIRLCKVLPRSIGYSFSSLAAFVLSTMKRSDLIRNITANQTILLEHAELDTDLNKQIKAVIKHAGKCYYDLYHNYHDPEMVKKVVPYSDEMDEFLSFCAQKQGTLVVAPHLSNFDLVVQRLIIGGLKAKVLPYQDPNQGYQLQNDIRMQMGMDLLPIGDPNLTINTIEYLKAGGVVATGIDRPFLERKRSHWVSFLGQPSPLPVGHITMALAADVPITVVSAIMRPDGKYGFQHSGPLQLKSYPNKKEEILKNAEMILQVIAEFILEAPDQWLMYYPVWPDAVK